MWLVYAFTVVACGAWVFSLVWASRHKRDPHGWHHFWILIMATVFWWLGESLGIRLGHYDYPNFPPGFPWRLALPWGGTVDHPDVGIAGILRKAFPSSEMEFWGCHAKSWDIPIPVILFEAAVLFSLFRISALRFKHKGEGALAALAIAGASGLMLVNFTAMLDPVVSKTRWCDAPPMNPGFHALGFGLWTWFTNIEQPGYWFGIPVVNYAAWFLAAAVFSFVGRLDDYGRGGFVRKYPKLWMFVIVAPVVLAIYFVLLIPIKFVVDAVLVHGQQYLFTPHPVFVQSVWQFGVLAANLAAGLLTLKLGKRREPPEFDWGSAVPQLSLFGFTFVLAMIHRQTAIIAVWIVTAAIANAVIFWPRLRPLIRKLINRLKQPPIPIGEAGPHG